jgi:MFS family permease
MAAKGVPHATALQMMAFMQLTVIASMYLYSKLNERIVNRQRFLRLSLILRLVMCIVLFFVPSNIYQFLFLFYIIMGTGHDMTWESGVIEYTGKNNLDFGKFRMFGSLGFTASGFIVSALLVVLPDPSFLLLFAAGLNALLLLLNLNTKLEKNVAKVNDNKKAKLPLPIHAILLLSALVMVMPNSFGFLLNGHFQSNFDMNLQQATLWASIAVLMGSCISEVAALLSADKLIAKYSARKMIAIGFMCSIARWSLAFLAPNAITFAATYLFHGFTFAFIYLGLISIMKQIFGEARAGKIAVRMFFYANISSVIMAQLYTLLLDSIGVRGFFGLFIILSVLLLIAYIGLVKAPIFNAQYQEDELLEVE